METKGEELDYLGDLQDWQEEILRMNIPYETFELQPQQKEMIEKLLFPSDSNPYWVEKEYKVILERVLIWGFYKEEDREALNYARECYLRGSNWIK
jgi:hypothetical protein